MDTSTATQVDVKRGLAAAEVADRVARGATNDIPDRASRSIGDIVRANVFTRINAILGVLLVIVLATGSPIDGLFGLLIIANSGIGIIQEVRAKRTLDKLAIVSQAKPMVRRDGSASELAPHEVVLDDIIELGPGDQVVVDGTVVEAEGPRGRRVAAHRRGRPGGQAGRQRGAVGQLRLVRHRRLSGDEGRPRGLRRQARRRGEQVHAGARRSCGTGINDILRFVTYLMVPAGLLIIYNQLFLSDESLPRALTGMVAALVPMVPEGLVLLTSVAFAVGVIRLGQRQCLVQELPAIEGLARVDVVCADKTGTLTENGMRLAEVRPAGDSDEAAARRALAAMAAADPRPNASVEAIRDALPETPGWGEPTAVAPFSSAKKWSGQSFGEQRQLAARRPGRAARTATPRRRRSPRRSAAPGCACCCSVAATAPSTGRTLRRRSRRRRWWCSNSACRPDARETLDYFADQGVTVKVISGDNAVSVGAVAGSLGLPGGDDPVDARSLPDDRDALADTLERSTTFGRVRPDQKRAMVGALQSRGHTVAMTGDGVNDVLALKDADIGVAMGSGSPATRAVAQIVLLDNRFATLPHVVGEGRRVIGNIERVSNLFLTKTVYSVLLALLVGAAGVISQIADFDPVPYPFLPRHVTLAAWFTIGIPAFILSLAPNNERAQAGVRAPRDAPRRAVGDDHRHRDVRVVPARLCRRGSDRGAADAGGHLGADHADHHRPVGARGRRPPVHVVEAAADRRLGGRRTSCCSPGRSAASSSPSIPPTSPPPRRRSSAAASASCSSRSPGRSPAGCSASRAGCSPPTSSERRA